MSDLYFKNIFIYNCTSNRYDQIRPCTAFQMNDFLIWTNIIIVKKITHITTHITRVSNPHRSLVVIMNEIYRFYTDLIGTLLWTRFYWFNYTYMWQNILNINCN